MHARSPQTLLTLSSALFLAACALGSTMDDDDGSGGKPSSSGAGGDTSTSTSSTGTSSGTTSSSTSGTTSTSSTSSSSTSGAGGENAGGAGGSTSSSSSSSGTNNCAHDVCTPGLKLTMGCGDPCVDTVCLQDAYCCDSEWDQLCVDEADQFCGAGCGGGGGGGGDPWPGDLVITEIMNNPAAVSDNDGEWFEVYNDTGAPIDLAGLVIRHHATDPQAVHTISQSVVVAPYGYAVLGKNANPSTNGNVAVDYQYAYAINLANTADYLAIETGNAMVIDETSWDEVSGLDPNGKSRNLNPNYLTAYDNDTDLYFCEASSPIQGSSDFGSPGNGNDNCQ